jgi:WXG100 family type VII secretion target
MGDTGNLKVGYEALDQMAANILNAGAAVDDKLNAMESRMQGRMAEWSGDDQQAYLAAKAEWDKQMEEMLLILGDIAKAVNLSREEYQAAEKTNAARFGMG